MVENIDVTCLINRYWKHSTLEFSGEERNGKLIGISTENVQEEPERLIPVGIVLMEDGTFQSVPMEFIHKK